MSLTRSFLVAGLVSLPMLAADLAPTGKLRAVFLGSNPVQGHVDPQTGTVTGPVADLTKELAQRLGIAYVVIPAPDARHVIDTLRAHDADIGFLAFDATRAEEVDFSHPYAVMYNTYVVRADSSIRKAAEVDAKGVRVATVARSDPANLSEQPPEKCGSKDSRHHATAGRAGKDDARGRDRCLRSQSPENAGSGGPLSHATGPYG